MHNVEERRFKRRVSHACSR